MINGLFEKNCLILLEKVFSPQLVGLAVGAVAHQYYVPRGESEENSCAGLP